MLLLIKLSAALAVVVFVALKLAKKAADNERQAAEKSTKILEGLPIACFILDSKFKAIDCNHTSVKLFAHKSFSQHVDDVEISGKDLDGCVDCSPCEKQFYKGCYVREYLLANIATLIFGKEETEFSSKWIRDKCLEAKKNRILRFEHEHRTLNGELVPCAVTIVHIRHKKSDNYTVYIQDLRATRKMIDEMRLRQIAEEESLAKTRFLARMSHEIRTPLNAVLGTTQVELRRGMHPPETVSAFLRIQNSSTLLLSIINDILDLSKVEAGKFEVVAAPFVSEAFISEILQINHMNIENPNIDFRLRVDENLPMHQVGDVVRLKQVINNLLSNAFKYTKRGFVAFSVTAEKLEGFEGAIFTYSIKDNGRGMTDEQVKSLFNEFARFNLDENQSVEGIGLGMPIVQQLVLMMDGSINVISEPGMGTEIVVKIPQAIMGDEVIGKAVKQSLENLDVLHMAAQQQTGEIVPMPYGKVLVADDVQTNLDIMDGILSMYEISATLVESGAEAIEKIEGGAEYDVIFMDHMMPGMDGIETTRRLREMGYKNPIIALTANALKDNRQMFMASGFSEFMSKPIEIDELDRNLKRFVMRR